MSVIIKGLEMPKEQPLRIVLNPNGQLFVDHGVHFTEYETVEVPTPHGRLIDADKLLKKGINLDWSVQKWVSEVDIGLMPTIIEAEEGEEA